MTLLTCIKPGLLTEMHKTEVDLPDFILRIEKLMMKLKASAWGSAWSNVLPNSWFPDGPTSVM